MRNPRLHRWVWRRQKILEERERLEAAPIEPGCRHQHTYKEKLYCDANSPSLKASGTLSFRKAGTGQSLNDYESEEIKQAGYGSIRR